MCCSVGLSLDALMMSLAWLCHPVGSVDALQPCVDVKFVPNGYCWVWVVFHGTQLLLVSMGK